MSNQRSKHRDPDQLRFSGPELTELLDQVVAEHGESAAIATVNRVRSGGVAGFFCREEFEVVVDPDQPDEERPRSDIEVGPLIDTEPVIDDEPMIVDEPTVENTSDIAHRSDIARSRAPEPSPVFGGPTTPGSERSQDRFLARLERRLEEASEAETDSSLRRLGTTARTRRSEQTSTSARSPVAPAPWPDLAVDRELDRPSVRPGSPRPEVDDRPVPAFWRRLDRARDELASFLPNSSPVTAVIGPLPLATAVVRRMRESDDDAPAEVVVLTDRAGIVSEPSWRLVPNANRLISLVARRSGPVADAESEAAEKEPGAGLLIIIDVPVDLPHWVPGLQHRLRSAGVGLFRYAVPGRPTGSRLEQYRQGADVPHAIDLISRVEPDQVVALVADRHPIVSVAGAELTPELLLALRRHVGRADTEPDDG